MSIIETTLTLLPAVAFVGGFGKWNSRAFLPKSPSLLRRTAPNFWRPDHFQAT